MNKTTSDIINEYKLNINKDDSHILISTFIYNIAIVYNENQTIFDNDLNNDINNKNDIYNILLENIVYISSIEFKKKKDFIKLLTINLSEDSSLYLSLYLKFLYSINILKFPNEYKMNLLDNDMFTSSNIIISNLIYLSSIKGIKSKDVHIRITRFQQRFADSSTIQIQQFIHTIYSNFIIINELYKVKTIKAIDEKLSIDFINKLIITEENIKKIKSLWYKSFLLYLRKYYAYRLSFVDNPVDASNNKKYDDLILLNIAFYCDKLWLLINQTMNEETKSQSQILNQDNIDSIITSSIGPSITNTLKNIIIDNLKLLDSTSNSKSIKDINIDNTFHLINKLFTPLIAIKIISEGACFKNPKSNVRILALNNLTKSSSSSSSSSSGMNLPKQQYQTTVINNRISIISDVIMLDKIASVRTNAYQIILANSMILNTKVINI
jgi:hypothetical protein